MSANPVELPEPGALPAPINFEQFEKFTPEKFELVDGYLGYLFDGPIQHQARINLLALLMTNEGLARVLLLAPEDKWLRRCGRFLVTVKIIGKRI